MSESSDTEAFESSSVWSLSGRKSLRLLVPASSPIDNVDLFLASDGKTDADLLERYIYEAQRSSAEAGAPNERRYRDIRQVLRSVGLVYDRYEKSEADAGSPQRVRRIYITALGEALRRWREARIFTPQNAPVLGRYAAQALSACQLRNPLEEGTKYKTDVTVFPYAFIWRALAALDWRISSDELNRAIVRTKDETSLEEAIERIKLARVSGDLSLMGAETVSGSAKNDRLLVWMSLASFGWLLIEPKAAAGGGQYTVAERMRPLLEEASASRHVHKDFADGPKYVEFISSQAALPPDLRRKIL